MRVDALRDYVVTAELVAPGDPHALGEAIDALLADPARRERLAAAARERAAARTYAHYFPAVRELVERALPSRGPG